MCRDRRTTQLAWNLLQKKEIQEKRYLFFQIKKKVINSLNYADRVTGVSRQKTIQNCVGIWKTNPSSRLLFLRTANLKAVFFFHRPMKSNALMAFSLGKFSRLNLRYEESTLVGPYTLHS